MIDEEPYAHLRSLKPAQRRRLEREIARLAKRPFTEPSYIDFDADGRELFHLFIDRHTLIYHVDHAVRRILILQISLNP
jgi:mRNA-degrading endonuclease RelE of RelBE toxin-antitoxin system